MNSVTTVYQMYISSYNMKMTLNSVNNLNGVLNYLCSYFAIY